MTDYQDNLSEFEENIKRCLHVLQSGGLILYPTDTVWGIGCDATNYKAVKKVYKAKKRLNSKSMIVLVDSLEMLSEYVEEVPETVPAYLTGVDAPVTIVYPAGRNLAQNLFAPDKSIAIRVVHDEFCVALIRTFGKPIVSTSANLSGEPTPVVFNRIDEQILERADYIVSMYHDEMRQVKGSTIVKIMEDGSYKVIRN